MSDRDQMWAVLADLIGAVHWQAKELEKLVEHLQQVVGHLGYRHQFSVVAAELSELNLRVQKLAAEESAAEGG